MISTNAGTTKGGEAIKAWQFFDHLLARGHDARLLTHDRNRAELTAHFPPDRLLWVEDDGLQRFLWRVRPLRGLLNLHFHRAAARIIRRCDPQRTVLHYLCPISPVLPRLSPRGYRVVMGPLNGNIPYPPDFRARMGWNRRLSDRLHGPAQRVLRWLAGDKRRAHSLLVSGQARTRASLRLAGADPARMQDVLDAGLPGALLALPRRVHAGRNPEFVTFGRLVDFKGVDLAIRALARTAPDLRLTIHGDGPQRAALTALARAEGVARRVTLAGWLPHGDLPRLQGFRGFVFPSLAEANGIAMQEAMALGLPVIALRWGGPAALATDDQALFLEPGAPEAVIDALARAMDRLAGDPALAESIATAARARAEADFGWPAVAASWLARYPPALDAGRPGA